jgi:hypothetical protein
MNWLLLYYMIDRAPFELYMSQLARKIEDNNKNSHENQSPSLKSKETGMF